MTPREILESLQKGDIALQAGPGIEGALSLCTPSSCTVACPAGVNVKSYVSLIADRRYAEALDVVHERLPFAGICGRVCFHPCEASCNRSDVDEPVSIRALKRFIADWELAHPRPPVDPPARSRVEEVAVVGAGPAGLTAAADLARMGYGVTVYDALGEPGGMMLTGIPSYRLPRDILRQECEAIARLGVDIRTGVRLGADIGLEELHAKYAAVFLGLGAHQGYTLGIPGEQGEGVLDAIRFLREFQMENRGLPGKNVLIIGGGNSAIDASRTSLRLGADTVTIVYRRTRKEMPATDEEVEDAEEEGIRFLFLTSPVEVIRDGNGRVTGLRCIKNELGEPDASGRRRPVPVEGSEYIIDSDCIIPAVGQASDLDGIDGADRLQERKGRVAVDADTLVTPVEGVYAGGDVASGPASIIDAVADGHRAADSIHRFLMGWKVSAHRPPTSREVELRLRAEEQAARIQPMVLPPERRRLIFDEVEQPYTEAEAVAEASRCLRCGPCDECAICVTVCHKRPAMLSLDGGTGPGIALRVAARVPLGEDGPWPLRMSPTSLEKEGPAPVFRIDPLTCKVDEKLCRGCGDCAEACPYDIPELIEAVSGDKVTSIDSLLCRGCGACLAVCRTGAISQGAYSDEALVSRMGDLRPDGEAPQVVHFTCRWWHGQADAWLGSPLPEVPGLVPVTVPCCSRLHSGIVLQAFEKGADGVLVTGCRSDVCKYGAVRNEPGHGVEEVVPLLKILGLSEDRFRVIWAGREDRKQVETEARTFVEALGALRKPRGRTAPPEEQTTSQ